MANVEQLHTRPNGQAGTPFSRDLFTREGLGNLARSPGLSLPISRYGKIQVSTDRVRARPAVSPNLSMMIGATAIGLGVWGLLAPRSVARTFGSSASPAAVQALFGARELASGVTLAADPTKSAALWGRVVGDVFDICVLSALNRPSNPKRGAVTAGLAFVLAVTALDLITATRLSTVQRNYI